MKIRVVVGVIASVTTVGVISSMEDRIVSLPENRVIKCVRVVEVSLVVNT